MSKWRFLAIVIVIAVAVAAVFFAFEITPQSTGPQPFTTGTTQLQGGMMIASPAFQDGQRIPFRYTCDGENISPPLTWSGAPAETKTYALIVDDPDAPIGVFTHWVVFNIPASSSGLHEKFASSFPSETVPGGMVQGKNSAGNVGYIGPCPPSETHRYVFHLYALDTQLNLQPGATKQDVRNAMEGHILAQALLTGLFGRG